MKYCIYCGQQLIDEAKFCFKCGNKVLDEINQEQPKKQENIDNNVVIDKKPVEQEKIIEQPKEDIKEEPIVEEKPQEAKNEPEPEVIFDEDEEEIELKIESEPEEEIKEEPKEEPKEEIKEEAKEEPKEEIKEDALEKSKPEEKEKEEQPSKDEKPSVKGAKAAKQLNPYAETGMFFITLIICSLIYWIVGKYFPMKVFYRLFVLLPNVFVLTRSIKYFIRGIKAKKELDIIYYGLINLATGIIVIFDFVYIVS